MLFEMLTCGVFKRTEFMSRPNQGPRDKKDRNQTAKKKRAKKPDDGRDTHKTPKQH